MGSAERLSTLSKRYRSDPEGFRKALTAPVLVWETAPAPEQKLVSVMDTLGGYALAPGSDPLVYRLERGEKPNAFGLGITLGRTPANDVAVGDPSVSRFHAFFQYNEGSGAWYVVDAESHNGTYVNEVRQHPGVPAILKERLALRFGGAKMRFFTPRGFEAFLLEQGR